MSGGAERPAELFALDRATCLALLKAQHVGRLVIGGDDPEVIPVNYTAVDEVITLRTAAGGWGDRPLPEPVVFEVDMFDDRTRSGWSVIVHGQMVPLPPGANPPDVETWAPGQRDRWLVVPVEAVTGRLLRGAVEAPAHRGEGYM